MRKIEFQNPSNLLTCMNTGSIILHFSNTMSMNMTNNNGYVSIKTYSVLTDTIKNVQYWSVVQNS